MYIYVVVERKPGYHSLIEAYFKEEEAYKKAASYGSDAEREPRG